MALLVSEYPAKVQTIWQRFEAAGYSDPWFNKSFGLYAYEPNAHMEDDRVWLCRADGSAGHHVGNPCFICGVKHDYIDPICNGVLGA